MAEQLELELEQQQQQQEIAGTTSKIFSYTTPSNYPNYFISARKQQKDGDLVPHVLYADYRIVLNRVVDFMLYIPAMCTFSAPFDRLATLQQTGQYHRKNFVSDPIDVQCITEIYNREGVNGLFCGNGTHLLYELLAGVIRQFLFEFTLASSNTYVLIVAKFFSRFITYPLSTIYRRTQISSPSDDRTLMGNIKIVIHRKGPLGLWSGFFSSFLLDILLQRLFTTVCINNLPFHYTINFLLGTCAYRAATHSLNTVIKIKQTSDLWPSYGEIFSAYGPRIFINGLGASMLSSCSSIFGVLLCSYITRIF